jgi:hypothetical protein
VVEGGDHLWCVGMVMVVVGCCGGWCEEGGIGWLKRAHVCVVCMKVARTHHRHVKKSHPEVSLFSLEISGIKRIGSGLV